MENRIVIVTGANRGIGKVTARTLAEKGYTVVMACRNLESARAACEEIKRASNNQRVSVLALDLGSISSIKAFVSEFAKTFGKLNILVNNAGISVNSREKTVDGLEKNVGTNYFGTFLLTNLLLPLFEPGRDDRIVNLSSTAYMYGKYKLAKLNDYRWIKAYSVSKYLILLFTLELAERLKGKGITVNAVHPGIVRTSIMMTNKWYDAIIKVILAPFFVNVEEGAKTSVFLADSSDARGRTGEYFVKCQAVKIPKRLNDPKARASLWEETEKSLQSVGR